MCFFVFSRNWGCCHVTHIIISHNSVIQIAVITFQFMAHSSYWFKLSLVSETWWLCRNLFNVKVNQMYIFTSNSLLYHCSVTVRL